jgi:hypothetical protein
VCFFDSVDRGNVGMVERGEHLRLALEPCEPLGVLCKDLGQDFQRDVAAELGVSRAIDLATPPAPMSEMISYGPRRVPGWRTMS